MEIDKQLKQEFIKLIKQGKPINFRGIVYSTINERGVAYLSGLVTKDLKIGAPLKIRQFDCVNKVFRLF